MKCHCGKTIQSIMKIFCAGFNLYGQFLNIKDQCIKEFTCIKYNNVLDVQMNQSCLVLKTENCNEIDALSNCVSNNKIYIDGFANNKDHQHTEFSFDNINQISVSNHKLLFLTNEGRIFCVTYNPSSQYEIKLLPDITQTEVEQEDLNDIITVISSGARINIAYSTHNFIYNIPTKLSRKLVDIIDVRTGREHCLCLTKAGAVYSFGGNSRGQLGLNDIEDKDLPESVTILEGIKIVKIACGSWHSAALSDEGDLYTWGWNSNGQLGVGSDAQFGSIITCPKLVELDENIIDVSCGSRHTIILTDKLQLYGCGWNKYYQLGQREYEENNFQFMFLYSFSEYNVIGLRCGSWNTVVLISD